MSEYIHFKTTEGAKSPWLLEPVLPQDTKEKTRYAAKKQQKMNLERAAKTALGCGHTYIGKFAEGGTGLKGRWVERPRPSSTDHSLVTCRQCRDSKAFLESAKAAGVAPIEAAIEELRAGMKEFRAWWLEQHKANPESYPLTLTGADPSEWFAHLIEFLTYRPDQQPEKT